MKTLTVTFHGAAEVTIDGQRIPVRATVATLNGFSAHADQDGLLVWASRIPGKPRWLVNHGEPEAAQVLAARLAQRLGGDAVAVREGAVVDV